MDFDTFLMKYLYVMRQVTPPASPQLEADIKQIWGVHTGKRAAEALTAKQEDMVDEVLGKPPVVRCRVCHKPSETGVHPECTRRVFSCADVPDHTGVLPPLVRPPPPNPNDHPLDQSLARTRQTLYMADLYFEPARCPQCGGAGELTFTDCPECRPGSSKVSRKRQHQ